MNSVSEKKGKITKTFSKYLWISGIAVYRGGRDDCLSFGRGLVVDTLSRRRAKDITSAKPRKSLDVALTLRKPKSLTRSSTSEASFFRAPETVRRDIGLGPGRAPLVSLEAGLVTALLEVFDDFASASFFCSLAEAASKAAT